MQSQLLAQSINNPVLGPSLGAMNGVGFFQRLLPALILGALVIGVIIFFFMFLSGALSWITSGGDKMKTEAARNRLTNAIVGLVILLSFFAIINLLENFFGIDIIRLNLGPLFIGGSIPGPGPVGSASCPCSAALGGGCASLGTVAVGPGGACYQCTSTGWSGPIGGACGPITCLPCP
jgi:hypothetical protein